MNKAVLISIQPKWCELIANGKKTVEVRKSKPTVETPFKCYIYETRCKRSLLEVMKDGDDCYGYTYHGKPVFIKINAIGEPTGTKIAFSQQKVIGEFVCDRIEEFHEWQLTPYGKFRDSEEEDLQKFLKDGCLSLDEVFEYRKNLEYYQPLYNWHISELKIYDKPKEVSEFKKGCNDMDDPMYGSYCEYCENKCYLKRPPQSWCYVEEI